MLRDAGVVYRDTQADKDPPGLSEPEHAEENVSVLHHAAGQLITGHRQL